MKWTKTKTVILAGMSLLLAAGTTAIAGETFPWQVENPTPDMLDNIPAMVKIVPTKFPKKKTSEQVTSGPSSLGIGVRVQDILAAAYDAGGYVSGHKRLRMLLLARIPPGQYDYIVNLKFDNLEAIQHESTKQSSGNVDALQQELKKQFGLVGRRETIVTNVLLLKVKFPNAQGLKPSTSTTSYMGDNSGRLSLTNQPISTLADMVEARFRIPVMDQTGLTDHFDFNLKWDEYGKKVGNRYPDYPNLAGLKQSLLDQLGLELVPANMPIEMLVIEKAN